MSWKGGPTWMSRKATFKDAEDVDTSFASYTRPGCPGRVGRPGCPGRLPSKTRKTLTRLSHLTPDQDVLEGWADLDFQEGHPMRREGRSFVLRVTYTRPGCPGRVGRPGFPGRSSHATRRAFTRPSRHLHPTRMSWKGGPTWISRGVTLCDAKDVHTPLASLTSNQDILEKSAHLVFT